MDQELKQYLDTKFAEVDAKFAEVDAKIERVDAKIERVDAKIERVETALLTEFHKWASPAEMRARTHAAALRAIDLEMEGLTERVEKLERKKEN